MSTKYLLKLIKCEVMASKMRNFIEWMIGDHSRVDISIRLISRLALASSEVDGTIEAPPPKAPLI
jgi:hypothetical protein